jgi:hypothetical protein
MSNYVPNLPYFGGRKITKLSNGWLIAVTPYYSGSVYGNRVMKSTDNGATWTFLTTLYNDGSNRILSNQVTIISKGTTVYFAGAATGTGGYFYTGQFDATTVGATTFSALRHTWSELGSVDMVYSSATNRGHIAVTFRSGSQWGMNHMNFNMDNINGGWNVVPLESTTQTAVWHGIAITVNNAGYPMIYRNDSYSAINELYRGKIAAPVSFSDFTFGGGDISGAYYPSPTATGDFMSMCRNPINGWMYLSYTTQGYVRCVYSPDNGATWSSGGTGINHSTSGFVYGISNTVDAQGRLNILYVEKLSAGGASNLWHVVYDVNSITSWGTPKLVKQVGSSSGIYAPQMLTDPFVASDPVRYSYLFSNVNDWTTVYDVANQAPNAPIPQYPLYGNSYNSSTVPVGWVFQDPDAGNTQSAWTVQISRNSAFTDVILDTGKVVNSNQSWEFYGIPDGVYYYRIKTWDNNDVEGPYNFIGDTQWFRIDTVKPTSAGVNTPQYLNLASGTFRVWAYGVTDSGSGINRVQFPTSNITVSGGATWIWFDGVKNGATNDWYCDIPLASFGNAEGMYFTDPYIYDNAGNLLNTGRIDTLIDRTNPTISSVSAQQYTTRGKTIRAWAYGVADNLGVSTVTVHLVRPDLSYYAYGSATRNGATNDWYVDINVGADEVQGQWYADFRAVDQANNVSLVYSAPFTVMSLPQVNIGGTWKAPTDGFANVGGTWRRIVATFVNIGGTWRKK